MQGGWSLSISNSFNMLYVLVSQNQPLTTGSQVQEGIPMRGPPKGDMEYYHVHTFEFKRDGANNLNNLECITMAEKKQ